ncbi:MAG TPA: DUF305 domain-containing protein [Acidimicrobiales bacterium]|nr:DUF305 domain-containing protein [Acidimicrobiales bacterium]
MSDAPRGPAAVLAVALLFLAGAGGYAFGARGDTAPSRSSVDVGFLYDMIGHHEQALTMANAEVRHGTNPNIRNFAREIILFQSYEIGQMQRQLEHWGYERDDPPARAMAWMGTAVPPDSMPGMASAQELELLEDAQGATADALFVPLMQDHHRGGIHMAEHAAESGSEAWVRDLAGLMARNQRSEIIEMGLARDQAGLPKSPPGYVPAVIPEATHPH